MSGKVAKKEHTQIVEVLKYIQAAAAGPVRHGHRGERRRPTASVKYDVTLHERRLEDLRALQKYDRVDEKPFEAVAALSELLERAYSLLVRPSVREATPEWFAKALRDLHPLRVQHWAFSDKNPLLWALPQAAAIVRASDGPRAADNDGRRARAAVLAST